MSNVLCALLVHASQVRLHARSSARHSRASMTIRLLSLVVLVCVPNVLCAQVAPTVTGKIVWTSEDNDKVTLGDPTQFAVDRTGRIFLPDYKESVVHAYAENGKYLSTFGRKGGGPGEFNGPCCMAFDPRGRLWVRDKEGARYVVFSVSNDASAIRATPAFTVKLLRGDLNFSVTPGFDSVGRIFDYGHTADATDPAKRPLVRYLLDTAGRSRGTWTAPVMETPLASAAPFTMGDMTVTMALYQPFASVSLTAFGPHGEYANAASGQYNVAWYGTDGSLRYTLKQALEGPELDALDRTNGQKMLESTAKRAHMEVGALPFGLPARKTPIASLYFDFDGRLWVERTRRNGNGRRYDVYAPDGKLAFVAQWPAIQKLSFYGAARGNVAWAMIQDDDDVPRVIKVDFAKTDANDKGSREVPIIRRK